MSKSSNTSIAKYVGMMDVDGERYELHKVPTGNLIVVPEFGGSGKVVKEREPGVLIARLNANGFRARGVV